MPVEFPIYEQSPTGRLWQGELLSGIEQRVWKYLFDVDKFDIVTHPLVIVLGQDCDLQSDFNETTQQPNDKLEMPNVLMGMLHLAGSVKGRPGINSTVWTPIRQNRDFRYQFFERVPLEADSQVEGIGEMVFDFKQHFSLPADELYWQLGQQARRRCKLGIPFMQQVASRFAYFLQRIALPRNHVSE